MQPSKKQEGRDKEELRSRCRVAAGFQEDWFAERFGRDKEDKVLADPQLGFKEGRVKEESCRIAAGFQR